MTVSDEMSCPDCGDPMVFAFRDTSGVGAHKRGDSFNTTPDTDHFLCFPCTKAWKRRLSGPLTPDVVGELAFFSCRVDECGRPLTVMSEGVSPEAVELGCAEAHMHHVVSTVEGGLEVRTGRR
jgi:hypothetical protein